MKTYWLAGILLLSITPGTRAQNAAQNTNSAVPAPTPYAVAGRDANSSVWERTVYEQGPSGESVARAHRYTEMATGLNFKNPDTGEWEASSELIEQIPGGAVARHGQHKVTFAADIATYGAISMETPDGQTVQSHLLGLSYYDTASGQSVMIAEITNCIGQIVGTNQVWYEGAFGAFSGIKAAVRYSYTRQGFEQDIILEEQPLAPEAYGLNSSSTVLQAFTEFVSAPAPKILTNSTATEGQLSDETLSFGMMRIGRGRAFLMGDDSRDCPVCKEWASIDGRQFLIEEVPVQQIATELQGLPQSQASLRASNSVVNVVSKKRLLPMQPLAKAGKEQMKIAKMTHPKPGFLIDYFSLNTSLTNYTFQGDQTYYLTGDVNLYGSANTFEGAAVLKYAANVSLTVNTPLIWKAGPYRPVVMVAKDENTVGELISGSTGTPGTAYYAAKALYFDGSSAGTSLNIQNLRILNAKAGVVINQYSGHTLNDVQELNCGIGIAATNTDFALHNALFVNVLTNFTGSSVTADVEHLTASTAAWLNKDIGSNLFLTNCLLVAVTNLGSCSTQNVAVLSNGTGVFQTVGGGSYYLATNSPYRNAGTTNISPDTLTDLARKTTYPPIVYSNTTVSVDTQYNPQAQRDTDIPDLGYHPDPLDYVFGGVVVSSNVTFNPGTAVGWFEPPGLAGYGFGIRLSGVGSAQFNGTVTAPCVLARYDTVQEGGNGNWKDKGFLSAVTSASGNAGTVEADAQFTHFFGLSTDPNFFAEYYKPLIVRAQNCEFSSASCEAYWMCQYFTNCLFDRVLWLGMHGNYSPMGFVMRNCTMRGGTLQIARYGGSWPTMITNCAFDGVDFSQMDGTTNNTFCDYNAFSTPGGRTSVTNIHDIAVTNFNWQTSWLGNFYLPTDSPLTNAGSTTADLLGLYHFTTQTNQVKETNSIVDIAYHYVALNTNGVPIDSDGDGIPDYLEDANGNGLVDSGETDWQSASDLGLKVLITRPQNNSIIP